LGEENKFRYYKFLIPIFLVL